MTFLAPSVILWPHTRNNSSPGHPPSRETRDDHHHSDSPACESLKYCQKSFFWALEKFIVCLIDWWQKSTYFIRKCIKESVFKCLLNGQLKKIEELKSHWSKLYTSFLKMHKIFSLILNWWKLVWKKITIKKFALKRKWRIRGYV